MHLTVSRAENFRMVDIKIIAWSPLFINLQIIYGLSWELLNGGYRDMLFSRLNNACSPLVFNIQINQLIGIKDIPF